MYNFLARVVLAAVIALVPPQLRLKILKMEKPVAKPLKRIRTMDALRMIMPAAEPLTLLAMDALAMDMPVAEPLNVPKMVMPVAEPLKARRRLQLQQLRFQAQLVR